MDVLNPLDAAMITGDVLASPINIGAVLILTPPDDAAEGFVDDAYEQAVSTVVSIDHRLRRHPHRGLDTGGLWVWRDVDEVDMKHHMHRRTLPAGSDQAELWQLVGELHGQHLDRSRPLWAAYLIDGLVDGRFALYVKIHHVVVDGVAGMRMIADGLTTDPKRRDMPPFSAGQHVDADSAAVDSGVDLLAPLHRLTGAVGSGVNLVAGEARGVLAAVRGRTTMPAIGAPYTPFNSRLGHRRSVVAASWPIQRIRAVQDAAGVSTHDVITTVVGGVLRSWLADHDSLPGSSLVGFCPITVRESTDGGEGCDEYSGNRFGGWLCPLGTDLDDPVQRLRLVHRSMSEGKHHVRQYGSAASLAMLVPSMASTILQALLPVTPRLRTGYNVPISSVPGPGTEMYWNRAHVDDIFPVSAVFDGQTLNVTTCSYAGRVSIGYVADGDVMPDIVTLPPLTEERLRELESAVGVTS